MLLVKRSIHTRKKKKKFPKILRHLGTRPPQKVSTALSGEKRLKNIGLKECQIISLPGMRNHEPSRGVQMPRVGFRNSQEETGNTHDKIVPLSG